MSRAAWKYTYTDYATLNEYCSDLINNIKTTDKIKKIKPNKAITSLNYKNFFIIYQGKEYIKKKFTKYHLNYKFAQFIKTKKPCFFRSKKKINVKKK